MVILKRLPSGENLRSYIPIYSPVSDANVFCRGANSVGAQIMAYDGNNEGLFRAGIVNP